MPCRFASSGTVASSRSASRAILALNVASNFLRDLVIAVLHGLRHSRTLHTLTSGPISGGHFTWHRVGSSNYDQCRVNVEVGPIELGYEEAVWNRAASKFLYILDLKLVFTRRETAPD